MLSIDFARAACLHPRVGAGHLVLRSCREDDLPLLEWFGMFAHDRSIIREAWSRSLLGHNEMLVVDAGGFPVAQLWIDLAPASGDAVPLLWAFRVLPGLQGRGIGTALLSRAERRLAASGFATVELQVEHANTGARRLYARLGYRALASNGRSQDTNVHLLRKQLPVPATPC